MENIIYVGELKHGRGARFEIYIMSLGFELKTRWFTTFFI